MSEKEEKIPITIRLTPKVHNALSKYKKLSGMSVSSQIYASVSAWLFLKGLLTLEDVDSDYKNNKKKVVTQPAPLEIMGCSNDSCEFTPS